MIVGICSDSHGHAHRLAAVMDRFTRAGCEAVVHCGDLCEPEDIELLAAGGAAVYLAAGNMDRNFIDELAVAAEQLGVTFAADFVTVDIGSGKHLAATHGHRLELLEELIAGEQFAYVCHGHTHRTRDDCHGPTRILNPGALYNPKSGPLPTALLLDTAEDQLSWLALDE
jgi:uncharacterized protein